MVKKAFWSILTLLVAKISSLHRPNAADVGAFLKHVKVKKRNR